jgi:hypothetical protein
MTSASLTIDSFKTYPPEGRALAQQHLDVLCAMPLAILPGFLGQIRNFDWQFPKEQDALKSQIDWLAQASAATREKLFAPFDAIKLSAELESCDWVRDPQGFMDRLSIYLWQSRQIDRYHAAAVELFRALPLVPAPAQPSLVLAVIGRDAPVSSYPLFTRLREHGLYARGVSVEDARETLLAELEKRASAAPAPYAHWYVDGGDAWTLSAKASDSITCFTYPQLAPINDAVLREMNKAIEEGTGPEVLESRLSHLEPSKLSAAEVTPNPRLQRLYTSLLTVGSGTQIYSTSFLQAAAVEILRRVQPSTLYFRFAPRRKQASLNDFINAQPVSPDTDPEGSLVDADMAAYYAYLQLAKLPGGTRASFIAWVENRSDAFVIGPGVTKGVESTTPLAMKQLLSMALA